VKLLDKVAIVTGSGRGIGREIALRLAREGADIVVVDIDSEPADKVVDEIKALGRRALIIRADVTQSEDVNRMSRTVLDKFGKLDILVNNVGGSARDKSSLFCESKEEVWDEILKKNLTGVLKCCRAVIGHMIERRGGRIINITSIAGEIGTAGLAEYSAAKGGVIAFTRALAKEVASCGITVNGVSPGPIEISINRPRSFSGEGQSRLATQTGFDRFGKPEEIANMVAFLASDEADFISGQNLAVSGLMNIGGPRP